jgi:hypothetical protein
MEVTHFLTAAMTASSIVHQPQQMEVLSCKIRPTQWLWHDSPDKLCSMFHGFETGMGCLLLWPDPGNSGLQLSQHCYIAVRLEDLCWFAQMNWSSCSSFRELTAVQDLSHITVATAETHHLLPHCAHINCLISVNSANTNECQRVQFYSAGRNSMTPLLRSHFMSGTSLPECSSAAFFRTATELTNYCRKK